MSMCLERDNVKAIHENKLCVLMSQRFSRRLSHLFSAINEYVFHALISPPLHRSIQASLRKQLITYR